MTDLLTATAELIDVPSVSHGERELADRIEERLRAGSRLSVERVGDNVVARTDHGRPQRIVVAGHTDTVPANGNERATIDADAGTVSGLGAADMKGGLAVMLDVAAAVDDPAIDVTWVFYACEETTAADNGLGHLFRDRPDLVAGDVAILAEPTGAVIEAGCQGSMRLEATLTGTRAHTARPWMGRNAIHRLGELLRLVAGYEERRPVIDGCEYREALQAVGVSGGVAGNVVPDRATVTLNHRFAPDRSADEAEAALRRLLAGAIDDGDSLTVVDVAVGAPPNLAAPILQALVERHSLPVRAKLGWTDVARFSAAGMPAVNFGPGDPLLAHTAGEFVTRADLERVRDVLTDLLAPGPT